MRQYYVLTLDPNLGEVFRFIESNKLEYEVHLNRTRFWIPEDSRVLTEFLLCYAHCCPYVED